MWFLFHRTSGTKAVAGGETLVQECPSCKRTTKLVEVEVSEKVGVWFVDVVEDKERAFRCTACGDTFDVVAERGEKAAPARTAVTPPRRDRTEELAAEQRRRDAEMAARRGQIEERLDDELAALKKKMGR